MTRHRRVAATLLVAYLVIGALIVLWPNSGVAAASVGRMTSVLGSLGAPAWVSRAEVEFLANVLLFVPLSFLGSFLVRSFNWQGWLVLGFCASGLIEFGQLLLLSGRNATVGDVVANSLGALLGALLVLPVRDRMILALAGYRRPMLRKNAS